MAAPLTVKCPCCGMSVIWEQSPQRPFCSDACRRGDWGNWILNRYSIVDKEPEVNQE